MRRMFAFFLKASLFRVFAKCVICLFLLRGRKIFRRLGCEEVYKRSLVLPEKIDLIIFVVVAVCCRGYVSDFNPRF